MQHFQISNVPNIQLTKLRDFANRQSLIDHRGRKYLTATEREQFFECVYRVTRPDLQTFALVLAYTGCRISEALALRVCDVDLQQALVYICTLKRRTESWREVPIPQEFSRELELAHQLRKKQDGMRTRKHRIWNFSRSTAFRHIVNIMKDANIEGPQACPKGLRHGFGIAAVEAGVPLPTIAAVLGHSSITTTAIYTTAIGTEARDLLKRMW